ncbi:hypothetical protein PISMIDRAFT_16557 [Pisolithus microcarpus 441]|uniref:Uncharacterized protein n=1 Tax=Pisolithus microcarpus 441 TaxID=765257 RepID=A0A0C9YFN1_9AGAM|nr:hypothetical protein BKA83DRAFT_16557 [Pisolithus microcarpus]KIK15376.1 hypothetical protein PISMIDRAFT_16557 [Pisolithus microcarpus 441]
MDPEDDSEEEVGGAGMQYSDAGPSRKMTDTGEVVNKGMGVAMDAGDKGPEESSPAWHASKDCIAFLRSIAKCKEVEEDDPLVSHLQFLLNSELGIRRAEDVMDIVGLIVSRLEQTSAGMKEPKEGGEGAVTGGGDREEEEKEEEEAPAVVPTQKRKRAESGIVTRGKKVAKQDGEKGKKDGEYGKKGVRTQNQTRKAMGL